MLIRILLGVICAAFCSTTLYAQSVCYGTTSNGRLAGGVQLPGDGPNFKSYGNFPAIAGRTYVHSVVRDIVVDAYRMLEVQMPKTVFKYAETGYSSGGLFKPHKTHQNGLSIDFMVPVVDANGASVHLPTNPFNKYGYNIEFDKKGRSGNYRIDFDALGAHIVALRKAAVAKRLELWRVIFDPRLQAALYKSKHGKYIRKNILIPKKRSWVRHDEHYHVDFKLPCKAMGR